MDACHPAVVPHVPEEISPWKSRALFLGALAAALLGLTLIDVAPAPQKARDAAKDADSIDCIVASAVFAGVGAAHSLP
jgi:hypothetical protein